MCKLCLTFLIGIVAVCNATPATCPVQIDELVWKVRSPYDARLPQPYFWIAVKNPGPKGIHEVQLNALLLSRTGKIRDIPFSYYLKNIRSHTKRTSIFPARLDSADEFDNVRVEVQSVTFDDGSRWDNSQLLDCVQLSK